MEILLPVLVSSAMLLVFIASQLFWIRRVRGLGERFISNAGWRRRLGTVGVISYLLLFGYNVAQAYRPPSPANLTLRAALLEAPFSWWVASSVFGFGLAMVFWIGDRAWRAVHWSYRKLVPPAAPDPPSPSRRRFLERTALAVSATPFLAGAYGLLYGRLNLETTRRSIRLRRLPKAFCGFRIAQLSDIHIGQYMSAEEIRKYVAIANELKPDLAVLTGDFITWDPPTQEAVVQALAGLKAPFGVFGCLGNHENYTEVQNSITRLFAIQGIRILRNERTLIQTQGERLNLLGVDFQSRRRMGAHGGRVVHRYLEGMERLVMPDTVNILLSHNPNVFDRAAELGIDLSLAGHTHGGQVTLEFIHPKLTPSRLVTPYVQGWFGKPGGQLYVNRGLGTILVPMRLGAPPEITLLELTRDGA